MVLHEVKREESVVVCKSTHLSRFTANDNVQASEPLIELITEIETDSDDDKESDIYPIMPGFAGLLVLIMIIVVLSELRMNGKIG